MLNRTKAPTFKNITQINVIKANSQKLNNNIAVHTINAGSQELIKLEFIFKAGMYQQPQPLVASCTNSLLECGTKTYTANEISEGIDFFGSFIELQVDQDFATVVVYSLNKYLNQTLKFIEEVIKYPTFINDELEILISNKKQKHAINSQKVSVLSRRKFAELIFGEDHPYGIDVKNEHFDLINISIIKNYFKQFYNSNNCTIIASGLLPKNLIETLNTFFGGKDWASKDTLKFKPIINYTTTTQRKHLIEKPDAIQNSIRIGRPLFNKTHPDYFHFQVLNTILGGYFGSRLMANVREDKGYTYGIGSGLMNLINGGYFAISTDVGSDVCASAIKEIYKEIKLLQTKLVDENELETVKNYILGQFLRSIDGPFSLADKFKSIWEFDLTYDYYDNYFNAVKAVKADRLRDLANQHLQEKDLIECVAGKKY
jgi:zinc protease